MPKPLSEQVVVIVGASSGIGRASAVAFARGGARVVCAARSADALDRLVEEITAAGGTAISVPTDIADPKAVRSLAASAQETYGGVDTWVTAAAVGIWGRVEDVSDQEFERVMRVNFLGHVHAIHAVLPIMRRAGGGVIIGISSVEGVRAVPLHAPYTASKWALRALYDSLRVELAQEGVPIAVSTILPASIDTPFFEHARSKVDAMPKPPPPVYSPELVAKAVVRAAEHPRREIPVGGAALAFFVAQRLSPALTDAVLAIPRLGARSQKADRPDNGEDNVDAPMTGTGRIHGAHSGRVLTRSPITSIAARLPKPGELLTAAVTQVQKRRSGPADQTGPDTQEPETRSAGVADSTPSTTTPSTTTPGTTTGSIASGGVTEDATGGTPPAAPGGPTTDVADGDADEVMDLDALQSKLSGWGGNEGPQLTAEQAAGLQEHEEPVAAADFGEQLTGDLGQAEVADETVDAPETVQPDTRLGPRHPDAEHRD